jgi:hypothetical protein
MADTKIILEDFEFTGHEIPEEINILSGEQQLSMHVALGGVRSVKSLGRNDDDISFSGLFFGLTAYSRAEYVDMLRINGDPLTFTIFDKAYTVVIKSFKTTLQKRYQIPYTITLLIVEELSNPNVPLLPSDYSGLMWDLITEFYDLKTLVNNPPLWEAFAILENDIGSLLPNTSVSSQIQQQLLAQISSCQTIVNNSIAGINI